jgi:hypothetical protein
MSSPLFSIVSDIFMKNFENSALEQADLIPKILLRYVDYIRQMTT